MAGCSLAALLVMVLCRSTALGVYVPPFGWSACRRPLVSPGPFPTSPPEPWTFESQQFPGAPWPSHLGPHSPFLSDCPPAPFPDCEARPGDVDAPFPACCPTYRCLGRCFSEELRRWFNAGDSWTLPGCRQARCSDTEDVSLLPCGLIATRPGCRAVRLTPDAEYPACCHQVVCDEAPPHEVQCYDKDLDRYFSVGEKWTLPGCGGQATCRSGGAVSAVGCPLQATNTPGCGLDDGDASLEYPQCCPKITCRACHSPRLDRCFGPGDTWTNSRCELNECSAGPYGAEVNIAQLCDEPQLPYPDCELIDRDLRLGDFPQCCPRVRCPGRCQDNGQWHRVGEEWDDADGCSRSACVDTDRVERLTCSPPAEDGPLRPGCRLVEGVSGAPFPTCCGRLVCYPDDTPPVQTQCRDAAGASRKVGDTWTEDGCVRSSCEVAEDGVAVVRHGAGCHRPPSSECQLVEDDHDHDHEDDEHHDHHDHDHYDHHDHDHQGEYPSCCPTYRCPRHCFSSIKDRWFSAGDRWSEGCLGAQCVGAGRVAHTACPLVAAGPGCQLVPGDPDAEYPNCCAAVACEQNPYG